MRENLLAATEKRLNSKLAELNGLKKRIQELLKKHDKQQEAKLKSLVKIYETMKPKDAARIFEQLEMPVLLDVVERMRDRGQDDSADELEDRYDALKKAVEAGDKEKAQEVFDEMMQSMRRRR